MGLREGQKIKETRKLRDPDPNINPPKFGTLHKVKCNVGLVSFYVIFNTSWVERKRKRKRKHCFIQQVKKKTCSPIHDPRVNQRACEGLVSTLVGRPPKKEQL